MEKPLCPLSSPVESGDSFYLAQPLTAPERGCWHRGGPQCEFRMFWGGKALLAPVEILEFTRKQWILKVPGRQSFALAEQCMLLNSGFWGSGSQALRDLGKLREPAIVDHTGLTLVGKADVSFPPFSSSSTLCYCFWLQSFHPSTHRPFIHRRV